MHFPLAGSAEAVVEKALHLRADYRRQWRRWVFLIGLCSIHASHAQDRRPQFSDFDSVPVQSVGANSHPVLTTQKDHLYRTVIRDAAKNGKVNFAGRYVLSSFGCGSSCLMIFALDAHTGKVSWLPFAVSWGLDDNPIGTDIYPLDFRPNSRLLLVHGSRNEHGHGLYYYVFEQDHFRLLQAHEDSQNGLWE